jgi:hypothetical protein
MKTATFRILAAVAPALLSLALVRATSAAEVNPQGGSQDVAKVVWTVVGVAVTSLILGIFYLFKRQIGAFPRNPYWIAPISVMPAGELPDETDDSHAAAGHTAAGHAPAH